LVQIPIVSEMGHGIRSPVYLNCALLNTQSLCNKTEHVKKFLMDYKLDLLFLNETWLKVKFKLISSVTTFEGLIASVISDDAIHRMLLIYRPPQTAACRMLIEELSEIVDGINVDATSGHLVILGDLNFHYDRKDNADTRQLMDFLETYSLVQHVQTPTHDKGHILDLVITRINEAVVTAVEVAVQQISDHAAVLFTLNVARPPRGVKTSSYRNLRSIDIANLCKDIDSALDHDETT
jgi:hypothetical protein